MESVSIYVISKWISVSIDIQYKFCQLEVECSVCNRLQVY